MKHNTNVILNIHISIVPSFFYIALPQSVAIWLPGQSIHYLRMILSTFCQIQWHTESVLLKIMYWAVQCSLFAYMVFHRIVNLNDQSAAPDRLWSFIHNTEAIILFAIIIQMFFLAREIKIKIKIQFIKSFGLIYLISFAVFEAYQQLSLFFLEDFQLYYFSTVGSLYFCVNIPALFYFHRFMHSHHQEMVEQPLSEDEMSQFCLDYNITPREKEIIELIMTGKSNQEIGECLHISIQTVKNIHSNIYKKIDIKNRIQLLNRIQAFRNTDKR